jgi:predicted nucleotidyltransferase
MRPSELLDLHRERIREIILTNGAENPRVFGSVISGDDSDESDLDLLVDPGPKTSYFALARIHLALEEMLNIRVDIATPQALPLRNRDRIISEARAL